MGLSFKIQAEHHGSIDIYMCRDGEELWVISKHNSRNSALLRLVWLGARYQHAQTQEQFEAAVQEIMSTYGQWSLPAMTEVQHASYQAGQEAYNRVYPIPNHDTLDVLDQVVGICGDGDEWYRLGIQHSGQGFFG